MRTGRQAGPSRTATVWATRLLRTLGHVRGQATAALEVPGVNQGFWGMCLVALGALSPAFLPTDHPFGDWVQAGPTRVAATALVMGGLAMLVMAWLRLRPRAGGPAVPAAAWWLWSLPILLAPPLFSRDAFSYAAQGLIVDRGMDPYTTAPISVPGGFADNVDQLWLYTPSPYGPLALQTQHLVVDLSFGNAAVAALGMRVPAVLSVAVLAYALPRLAERLGHDPDLAMWLGVLNPLVLMHLVGGAHNDAMMLALVVLALLLAVDGRLPLAALTVAAAAGYKQTAVLALVAVAGLVARARSGAATPPPAAYLTVAARTVAIAFAGFAALTALSGLGWGWVPNLAVPLGLRSLMSPATLLGSLGEAALTLLGVGAAHAQIPVHVAHAVGTVAGVLALVWVAWRLGPRRPVAAAAAAFAVLAVCGPVLHAWYLLPPIALCALLRPGRRLVQALLWLSVFFVGYSAFDVAMANGVWIVGASCIAWACWRIRRARLDVVPAAPAPLAAAASASQQ